MRDGADRDHLDVAYPWRVLDEDVETAWLDERIDDLSPAGLDANGWDASTWVLHAMYEADIEDPAPTVDEWRRARIEAGLDEPLLIGGVNIDEETTTTGIPLGFVERPERSAWRRLEWRTLAGRLGADLSDQKVAPCFRWFPYRSWPVSIQPPPEGSLDGASLDALTTALAEFGGPECVALYSFLASGGWDEAPRCFSGPVTDIRALIDPEVGRIGTPSNVWAVDRSWFILTDWDLLATKVSGPPALIEMIDANDEIETVRWP